MEKKFVKALIDSFGIGDFTTRTGIITFSQTAKISVLLSQFKNLFDIKNAVDALPIMSSTTRIDAALKLARDEFFKPKNGARYILINLLVFIYLINI